MHNLLAHRNDILKQVAESEQWKDAASCVAQQSYGKDGKKPPWKTPKSVSHFAHSSGDGLNEKNFAPGVFCHNIHA